MIVAIKDGVVAESGTHSELMAADGVYAALVNKQMKKESKHHNAVVDGESESDDGMWR